jgi:hypothetical protein
MTNGHQRLMCTVPWIVNGFFKLITPFIDPLTRQKLKFNDDMRQHVPPQQLWKEFHGDLEFEYDHATYWPALMKLCDQKQAEHHERWIKGGKQYGESELYIKGGDAPSVGIGSTPKEEDKDGNDSKPPVQSDGAQCSGDTEVIPNIPGPVLTKEGDKP